MLGSPKARSDALAYVLALCLAALAGWVDATGFIAFHGLFVSFMSGNSTKAVVDVGVDTRVVLEAARAVLAFFIGVILGELCGGVSARFERPLVLLLETVLLWLAVAAASLAWSDAIVAALLGLAMGTQNASVHKAEGISMALTYVTGTLVHIGRAIAAALRGNGPWRVVLPYLGLWLSLVCGGFAGALVAHHAVSTAMLAAAVLSTLLSLWSAAFAVARRV